MKNKVVLVTGADGFIGSHLVEMLFQQGYKVKALSQYNSFNSWGWLEDAECKENIEILMGDIRDPNFCIDITKDVEIIFNLAALIAIPYSYSSPNSYIETNVNGTINICQAAKLNGVRKLIQISTSEVYGTAKYVPIDEKHPLQAQSPYSASKIASDAVATSFYNSYNLPVVIARPFNTYGPRQSARAIIPTIISQIADGASEIKLGDLTPTRDFTYVKDTCLALIKLSECEEAIGQEVNIGSNFEISIEDTLNLIKKLMNSKVSFVSDNSRLRPKKSEVFRLWCDNKKLNELTNIEFQYSLKQGLDLTINWFRNPVNLKKYKAEIYNI